MKLEAGQRVLVQLFVVGTVPAPVTFSAVDLPSFATLDGPLLTLAPSRSAKGTYAIELVATAGNASASSTLNIEVTRFNSPPTRTTNQRVILGDDDGHPDSSHPYLSYYCPNPTLCTAIGVPRLRLEACDAEGDGLLFEVEIVPRGQPFSSKASLSSYVGRDASACSSSGDDACWGWTGGSSCASVVMRLRDLAVNQSYDFAIRISDEFGARVASIDGSSADANGWVRDARWGFDQGPCTTRQCACAPSGGPYDFTCAADDWCCSGVCDKSGPYGQFGFGICR